MWGTSKQEQLKETPQRMEGGVVINDFYKNIENVLHQKKINKDFAIRKQKMNLKMEFPILMMMIWLVYVYQWILGSGSW